MRMLFFILILLGGTAWAADTIRFGNRVITVGDDLGAVLKIAGEPARTENIETAEGGKIGERWFYFTDNKTITLVIEKGVIKSISEVIRSNE